MLSRILLSAVALFIGFSSYSQSLIASKDAGKHIGEKVTVTEKVYGGKFFSNSGTTLLNMGGDYPNVTLTLLIKGDDRKKFTVAPEEAFKGKVITVTGTVAEFKGKPEIIITDPAQITTTN